MNDNSHRTGRIAALLSGDAEDARTNLIDLLADAHHWCEQNGEVFSEIVRIAEMHFEAEMAGEE
jgi:membrane glycosyltransferase